MRTYIKSLFLLIILVFPCFALSPIQLHVSTLESGASGVYISETFDGSSSCGDGSSTNCDTTWDSVSSSFNFTYATGNAPLVGTYSGYNAIAYTAAPNAISEVFTTSDSINVYFQFNIGVDGNNANNRRFHILEQTDGTDILYLQLSSNASDESIELVDPVNVVTWDTAVIPSVGTTYHVWLEYTIGTGSNGIAKVYVSTDGTKGSALIDVSNGQWTVQTGQARFGSNYEMRTIYDQIIVSSLTIGSNPTP